MSIINELIAEACFDPPAKEGGKPKFNMDKLFDYAKLNGLDVSKFEDNRSKETNGRVRMSIGNMLKGSYNRNGKIFNHLGEEVVKPVVVVESVESEDEEDFEGDSEKG